jgi:hypothetical protein
MLRIRSNAYSFVQYIYVGQLNERITISIYHLLIKLKSLGAVNFFSKLFLQ